MKIVCVGAGRMGRGIGLAFALAGREVTLVDLKTRPDFGKLKTEAMAEMEASLAMLAELGAIPGGSRAWRRISVVQDPDALRDADLIFEAVPETLEAKRDAFARICGWHPTRQFWPRPPRPSW